MNQINKSLLIEEVASLLAQAAYDKELTGAAVLFLGKDTDGGMIINLWRAGDVDGIDIGAVCDQVQRMMRENFYHSLTAPGEKGDLQ